MLFLFAVLLVLPMPVYGEVLKQTMEGGMDVQIEYQKEVVVGRTYSISFLIKNSGWEDKKDIVLVLSSPDESIRPISNNEIRAERIHKDGSFGNNIDFLVSQNATVGQHFLNVKYTHVLLENNENPRSPINVDMAIPILIKEQPQVKINTITPESIFAEADFPFTVEILSEDINIKDVMIEIIPPQDIEFRGGTSFKFSTIDKGEVTSVTSRIITPTQEIQNEAKLPFQIIVTYIDDLGQTNTDTMTTSLIMRPRTFMEMTTEGGIWLGNFFIAPYVSLGTIIGIPVGTIISLLVRKKTKKPAKKKRS